jgi:SAM-dependent methyltransferase
MKLFEAVYLCSEPFLPALHQHVRSQLLSFSRSGSAPKDVLDVGGRKSHYTIGVPCRITVSDLPRETEVQQQLHLGLTPEIAERTLGRRSNLERVVFDDMTRSKFPDNSFDCIVAVEVLEHVEDDHAFVSEVSRVLRPGGLFLSTTPNGDYVTNHNPDHKRHYRCEQLRSLLASHLSDVNVDYAIRGGHWYSLALRSWSARHPLRTMVTMAAGLVNSLQSRDASIRRSPVGTQKLVGIGRKPN